MRRLVVFELKLGEFEPQDKGQTELYLRWLERSTKIFMSCEGVILQKIEELDIDKILENIVVAVKKAGLEIHIDEKTNKYIYSKGDDYAYANIADRFGAENEQQVLLCVFGPNYEDHYIKKILVV